MPVDITIRVRHFQPVIDRQWNVQRVSNWLLEEGRLLADVDELTTELGRKLLEVGAPLWRFRISMRTLHPLVTAYAAVWQRDLEQVESIASPHGLEGRSDYIGSPLEIISRTQSSFRRKLVGDLTDSDHTILHELKARGATDYFGNYVQFSTGRGAILVYNADRGGGFTEHDIENFESLAPTLAPVIEAFSAVRIMRAIADAYLGPRTGRLVLDGRITRGDLEKIDAAILMSDIRDWSGMSSRMAAEDTLSLANAYFEVIAQCVEDNDGEILKFIGDAVLAIFPTDEGRLTPGLACGNALKAAVQSLQLAGDTQELHSLQFGLGLHYGEVLYGNIGSQTRLDFTVMGQAVNITARIEGLCAELDQPLLFSQAFADQLDEPVHRVSQSFLKGHSGTFTVYTPGPAPRENRND